MRVLPLFSSLWSLAILFLLPCFTTAYSPQSLHDETLSVPGDNPLQYCTDPATYLLDISYVDLSPNPPQAGTALTIHASGNVTSNITAGAHAFVSVKLRLNFGQIPILQRNFDLCDQLDNDKDIDEKCPVQAGEVVTFTKDVQIPDRVPKGRYVVLIDAMPEDGTGKITCLQTEIVF